MKHLKLFEEYGSEFNKEYHVGDFYFKVTNGGPSEGTEIGDITVNFDKDGEEIYCEFEVYQPSSGDWGVTCDDESTASELGIELDDRGKVLDDDLSSDLLDAYDSGSGEGEWNNMNFVVEDVNPRGVIEDGWLLTTIYKDGKEEEVQFEIRQEALGSGRTDTVEPDGEEEMKKLQELGIEFSDDFQTEFAYIV